MNRNFEARFPAMVKFRAPAGLFAALEIAARQRHTNVSEMIRQLLLRELERDGMRVGTDGRVDHAHRTNL
jgi:hypothetical protein